jgi:hypothetical protein
MVLACLQYLAPRLFLYFDRQCTTRRFNTFHSTPQLPRLRKTATNHNDALDDIALCEALSRATRSGVLAQDALAQLHPHYCSLVFTSELVEHQTLIVQLLRSSIVDGYFIPAALDHAAHILREERHSESVAKVASSQARITIRVLTGLPIAVLVLALVLQPDIRSQLFSSPLMYLVIFGVLLNFCGRVWSQRLLNKSLHLPHSPSIELSHHICVLLRAGCSITEACLRSAECNELGAAIANNILNNESLADALQPLREGNGAIGNTLANTLVQASIDGLPVLTTIYQLSAETRTEQRRLVESRVQELPVRLTFPTVFFILPSFFLLAVAPFVVSQLHKMSLPFSPAT